MTEEKPDYEFVVLDPAKALADYRARERESLKSLEEDAHAFREELAAYAHRAWSGWMNYLFTRSMELDGDGSVTIPADLAERWTRQAATAYADLPENEKESDRNQADKIIAILGQYV